MRKGIVMDFIALFKEYGLDVGSIAAIIMLTGVIKTYFNFKPRMVPLIPVVLGFVFGFLVFITSDLSIYKWYQIVGFIFKNALIYAGAASLLFKIYRTTVKNR